MACRPFAGGSPVLAACGPTIAPGRFRRVAFRYQLRITAKRALVIEDDATSRAFLSRLLSRAGLEVREAADGDVGLQALYESRPDVVLLDLAMPGMDGWTVLSRIREVSDVPVLVISAFVDEAEKVRALQGGADDYMTKPSAPQELQARVAALLRRAGTPTHGTAPRDDGVLRIDPRRMEASLYGVPLDLTPKEFRLLSVLADHPNQTLSTDQLGDLTWGDSLAAQDRVKVLISRLRGKCQAASAAFPVETVRGFGYRYSPHVAPTDRSVPE